jgi:lipoate-protein ligase A
MRRIFYPTIRDPRINLALEEYCLRQVNGSRTLLLFYVNDPTVIIGRHQVTCQQVNTAYLHRHNIPVMRRISGGGAVYHDHGNLNFSVITAYGKDRLRQLQAVLQPVIKALKRLKLEVYRDDRDNLFIGVHKICGTAQYTNTRRLISHGSLLVNADLDALQAVLMPDLEVQQSRGIQSISSAVANIVEFMPRPMAIEAIAHQLEGEISKVFGPVRDFQLQASDWEQIQTLSATKYSRWEWNYGNDPPFTLRHRWDFGDQVVEVQLRIQKGIIKALRAAADQGHHPKLRSLTTKFVGKRFDAGHLMAFQPQLDFGRM